MKSDPLIYEARKAYRASDVCKVDKLLAEETRWKRKATIAENKLVRVRARINLLMKDWAQDRAKP